MTRRRLKHEHTLVEKRNRFKLAQWIVLEDQENFYQVKFQRQRFSKQLEVAQKCNELISELQKQLSMKMKEQLLSIEWELA
ncbi:MAG: hypothetical protein KZQ86_02705 [Candidatus Thiodiazotropha sp. (ex Lucinoma kastoroae)]|nr:hypothetical protein [Candidatus Thiodiazotropha sp. (ex Lucinoma kastoroae)]